MSQPFGFLQVDVDGLWAVRACYGRPEGDAFENDPCWSEGVARLERLFREAGCEASFFLVGRDLELDGKRRIARKLLHRGFELGNHSYTHRLGLTLEPVGFISKEIRKTDKMLRQLGAEPRGFRAPGYDIDSRVLRVVRREGYLYDASVLPTYLPPLLRVADAWLARRWPSGKRQFGRFVYGRAPREPYIPLAYKIRKRNPRPGPDSLVEIPVGTTPHLHLPLTAASLFGCTPARVRQIFSQLAEKRRPALLLLHAIDGTDCRRPIVFRRRRPSLGGFSLSGEEKEKRLRVIIEEFARHFRTVRADHFAEQFREDAL